MIIRKIQIKDIENYHQLVTEIIGNTSYYSDLAKSEELEEYSQEQIGKRLNDGINVYFVAIEDAKMIGFCHGYFDMGTFWINWIGTQKNIRYKGVASKILKEIEEYIIALGVHKIWLNTKMDNKESINFFLKHGYKIFAPVKNHWYHADFYFWEKMINNSKG